MSRRGGARTPHPAHAESVQECLCHAVIYGARACSVRIAPWAIRIGQPDSPKLGVKCHRLHKVSSLAGLNCGKVESGEYNQVITCQPQPGR